MNLNEYQNSARDTAIYPEEAKVIYPILGLVGEAGEVAEKYKKVIRDNNGELSIEKREEIKKEVGDVLWYISNLSYDLGFTLDDVATTNLEKLKSRKERGALQGNGDNR